MSIHTTGGPSEVLASTPDEPESPLDALLRQIIEGYFVLTDGQGSVSKWSEPAELLFGRPAQEVLGQSFFESLIAQPLPAGAQSWRAFLENGDSPSAPGKIQVHAINAEGNPFALEAVFVPVKLDEGFDFSLFLEDLGFELPLNLMQLRMRQQHPVVVRALRSALEPEIQPWDGWRTAGTLVIFKPLQATPWVEAELAAREAARAEADAEVEQAITNPDPGVRGSSVNDLDDAAAVVARLLSALERIDDLERMATALPAQVDEARRDAESSRSRAEAAEREAAALRADLQSALANLKPADDSQHLELLARMERLERARLDEDEARAHALRAAEAARSELAQRLERAEADRARAAEAIEQRVEAAVADAQAKAHEALELAGRKAEGAKESFESRIIELEKLRSGDAEAQQAELVERLERVRAEHEEAVQNARHQLAEELEGIERERERDAEAARAELRAALERIEHVQREADGLREQVAQMTLDRHEAQGLAGEDSRRLEELAREAEEARGRIEALRSDADALRGEASQAREEAAAVREQLAELQQGSGAGLDEIREEIRALRDDSAGLDHLREELSTRLDEGRQAADERFAALQAGQAESVEALRAEQERLQRAQAAAEQEQQALRGATDEVKAAHDEIEAGHQELRRLVAAARAERETFASSSEDALRQLAELRSMLHEHQDSISVQIPADAIGRDELDNRLSETRDAIADQLGEVRSEVRIELDARAGEGRAELEALIEQSRGDVFAALDETRGEIESLRGLEAGLTGRIDELTRAGEDYTARIEELAAKGGEDEAARRQAGEAHRLAGELAQRIDEIDRGAGSVLADVRAVRDRVDEVATIARSAQEAIAGVNGDELRQTVEGLRGDLERDSDELRAAVARLNGELEVARGDLERAGSEALGAREAATTAQEAATAAREDAGRAREEAAATRRELETGQERLGHVSSAVERLGETISGVNDAVQSAQTEATAARRAGKELTELVGEIDARANALRDGIDSGRERIDALGGRINELHGTAQEAGESAAAARAAADEHATVLRGELSEVRAIAEQTSAGVDAIRADVEAIRGRAEALAADAQAARDIARAGESRIEAMGAEVTFALRNIEEIKAGLSSAGQAAVMARREAEQAKKAAQSLGDSSKDNVHEVFQQLLGLAQKKSASGVHRRPSQPALVKKAGPVKREPRHGFDDVATPMAVLGLDGKFRELNPAFVKLVGYQEHEFGKAAWPSPHDRPVYQQQQEELTQLASGEIESVTVQSTYMHGQGLMVPVIGRLTAVNGEDGLPLHLLLEAEDRHHG